MKVEAIKRFYDRQEAQVREAGDTFHATEERVEVINSTRFGRLVKVLESDETTPQPEQPERPERPEPTVKDLKAILEARGVRYRNGARKAELVRLLEESGG